MLVILTDPHDHRSSRETRSQEPNSRHPHARIGDFWADPSTRSFSELLIDLEEDRYARAVVVGMLREADPQERNGRTDSPGGP